MSANVNPSVIEKLRKILAKTEEAGCTEAEAQSAMARASRLMAEHNLSLDQIQKEVGSEKVEWIEGSGDTLTRWTMEHNLAFFIAKEFFFVEGLIHNIGYGRTQKKLLTLFGQAHNVEAGKWAFNALLDAFGRLFREYRKKSGCPANERRMFVSGVAKGFREKMQDERTALEIERDIDTGLDRHRPGAPLDPGGDGPEVRGPQ